MPEKKKVETEVPAVSGDSPEDPTEEGISDPIFETDTVIEEKSATSLQDRAAPSHVETGEGTGSLITFMIVAFLAGLAALLTPCVFPMIPMTVSFFTGRSKNRSQG
ncbi:MAG TPA: cytochrome c biogenesis protein CcdA, partial [Anditalea sp.]|nr:cytochrome c biogenesis protein CcdA [Anditalea sp.]